MVYSIEDFKTNELIEELTTRGYKMDIGGYDYVDSQLFDDIVDKFDSLSFFDRQKLRDLIINFK